MGKYKMVSVEENTCDWDVVRISDGKIVLKGKTYQVASNVLHYLNNPSSCDDFDECYDVALAILNENKEN